MRRIELLYHQRTGAFVISTKTSSQFTLPSVAQDDVLEIAVARVADATEADGTLDPFILKPWSFSGIRASIGEIDRRPQIARFKLKVGASISAEIDWPADPDDEAAVEVWKNAVLAKLNAIAGAGAAQRSDPEGCPANYLYFTWTDAGDDRAIEIVEVRAVPAIEIEEAVRVTQQLPAFEQLVRLIRLPIAMATEFEFELPPTPAVTNHRTGGAGINAEQLLAIPSGAVGSFDLSWDGAHTRSLAVSATAAQIAEALNAIVADGSSNPSFRVEARGVGRFVIEFIGPLAGAAQALLVATARDQSPTAFASGLLDLRKGHFERALNGAASVALNFELVITDASGEETIIKPITVLNDMTNAGTAQSAEQQGAVLVVTQTVYVDNSTLDPIATVAAGVAFAPGALGESYSVAHGLSSRLVHVVGLKKIQADPERWRLLTQNAEFTAVSTSETNVLITPAEELSADEEAPNYFGNYRWHIYSPNAVVQLAQHLHTWDDIYDVVTAGSGSGLTLREKLDAIDAALGIVSGSLVINATNIIGVINAEQIDMASFISAILNALTTNPTLQQQWATMLKQTILGDETFLGDLFTAAITNANANTALTTMITNIFSSLGSGSGPALVFSRIPDFELVQPRPSRLPGLTRRSRVPVEKKETQGSGDNVVETSYTDTAEISTIDEILRYAVLPRLVIAGSVEGAAKTNVVLDPDDAAEGKVFNVSGDAVFAAAAGGRPRIRFADASKIAYSKGAWFEVRAVGTHYWPVEMERDMFVATMTGDAFAVNTGWNLQFSPQVQLASAKQVVGRVALALQTAAFTSLAADTDLASLAWTDRIVVQMPLTDVPRTLAGWLRFSRTGESTIAATAQLASKSATFNLTDPNIAVRLRTLEFDIAGTVLSRGAFTARLTGATDSIVQLA